MAAARAAAAAGRRDRAVASSTERALQAAPELSGRPPRAGRPAGRAWRGRGRDRRSWRRTRAGDRQVLLRLGGAAGRARRARARARGLPARPRRATRGTRRRCGGRARVREAIELLQMPEEYRRILDAADHHPRRPGRADDGEGAPARPRPPLGPAQGGHRHLRLLGAGPHHPRAGPRPPDVYPNHTFQPGGDRAARRPRPGRGAGPRPAAATRPAPPPALSDMSANNLFHYPAARVGRAPGSWT